MADLEYGLVEREFDGVIYRGLFLVEHETRPKHRIVTVCSPLLGEKSTQQGGSPAGSIAGTMLLELIREAKKNGERLPGR